MGVASVQRPEMFQGLQLPQRESPEGSFLGGPVRSSVDSQRSVILTDAAKRYRAEQAARMARMTPSERKAWQERRAEQSDRLLKLAARRKDSQPLYDSGVEVPRGDKTYRVIDVPPEKKEGKR